MLFPLPVRKQGEKAEDKWHGFTVELQRRDCYDICWGKGNTC